MQDPQQAEKMLEKIKKYPDTLAVAELGFLLEEADKLKEKAYEADLEEDEIADQHGLKTGTYEHLLPDPSYGKFFTRRDNLIYFMSEIGLPYVIDEDFHGWDLPDGMNDLNSKIIAEDKNAWLSWCLDHGIDIKLMN